MSTAALVITDTRHGRLGHARSLHDSLGATHAISGAGTSGTSGGAEASVLETTLRRVAAIPGIERIIIVHPEGQHPLEGIDTALFAIPVETHGSTAYADDPRFEQRRAARAWSLASWRGGLSGATVWDELLPAEPLAEAAERFELESVFIVGGDWAALDPVLCGKVFQTHRSAPATMKLCFTQSPPGLCGVALYAPVLRDMARSGEGFGTILAYNPRQPGVDPISKEVNIPIPVDVRSMTRRFIYDTPEARGRLHAVAQHLGARFAQADAATITGAARAAESASPGKTVFAHLPPQVVLELTPRRIVAGPSVVQHHTDIERADMAFSTAMDLAPQLAGCAVTLGGLGDALLYPRWREVVDALNDAGVLGVALETDLRLDDTQRENTCAALIDNTVDVLAVRLNADQSETYRAAMGDDGFTSVMASLQALFNMRQAHAKLGLRPGHPWIIPTLVKTPETLGDLEPFFERWWQLARHAVIQRWPTGGKGRFALAPDRNPVPMDGPWREPDPHQRKQRITVLSDGRVTLCGQDWLGRAALGNVRDAALLELWRRTEKMTLDPAWGPDDSPLCRRCFDFASLHASASRAAVCAGG